MAGDVANMITGVATIATGTEGATPDADVGYTQGGCEWNDEEQATDIPVDQELYPVDEQVESKSANVTVNLAEPSLANLALISGGTLEGSVLTLGAARGFISLSVTGAGPNGATRVFEALHVKASGAIKMADYKRAGAHVIPVTFKCFKRSSDPIYTVTDTPAA